MARVAERFSEEDLTRFLQIMLRTHSDLGYKQEQRFHLELGLLKMVHAQRLLPLEQLLSGEAAAAGRAGSASVGRSGGSHASSAASASRSSGARAEEARPTPARAVPASPFSGPSPFEADRKRKTEMSTPAFSEQRAPATSGRCCRDGRTGSSMSRYGGCRSGGTGAARARYEEELRRKGARRGVGGIGRCRSTRAGAQSGRGRVE